MTKRLISIVCGLFILFTPIEAQQLKVIVSSPGSLSSIIGNKKYNITHLTVRGALNGTDLRFLREMAGSDANQQKTPGKLRKLNLLNASFAKGGDRYITGKGKGLFVHYNTSSIPDYLFIDCHLEDFIFPVHTDTIGDYAFSHTGLRYVKLPEKVVVSKGAFYKDSLLENVSFPKVTEALFPQVFNGCHKLKQLQINNIMYISAYCLQQMDALERIVVKGYLGHADGCETVASCPKLKSIDFYGPVFSTGGSVFTDNCAQLEYITFYGPVLSTYFGSPTKCPAFKGYITKNIVCTSGYKDVIPMTPTEQLQNNPNYTRLGDQMIELVKSEQSNLNANNFMETIFSGSLYNLACRCSIDGNTEKAFKYLEASIEAGYKNYVNMKDDKDFNNIRKDKRFDVLLQKVRIVGDKLYILQHCAPYERNNVNAAARFTYASPSDSGLVAIKKYFNLDSIAGNGDEISRMKKLLYWFHDLIRHDGSSSWPHCRYNAITLSQVVKKENRGLNCRFMAEMLNEIYLAEGFKSRFLTCMPRDYDSDGDCHVINIVWSRTLHKWVWMDPTFCAYVTDDKGLLLHPGEVRERLIKGLPLVLNSDANWNHKEKETKERYLDYYMAKNLYLISAHLRSEFETENYSGKIEKSPIITLAPKGFYYRRGNTTSDDNYFWQAPEDE